MRLLSVVLIALFLISCGKKNAETRLEKKLSAAEEELRTQRLALFDSAYQEASNTIRQVFDDREPGERFNVVGEELYSSVLLPKFYIERKFAPAWITTLDSLDKVMQMVDFIAEVEFHGLESEHYHEMKVRDLLLRYAQDSTVLFNPYFLAHLDLLLTDGYFILSSHLYHGKLDPELLVSQWGIQRNKPELQLDLKLNRHLNSENFSESFDIFYPPHSGYKIMVAEAKKLEKILPYDFTVEVDPKALPIKPGDSSEFLPKIKEKLSFLDIYNADSTVEATLFDEATVEAVKHLQKLFGYNTDGAIGRNTLSAINLPIEKKLRQLYANMERLRWMPDSLERRHIMVNIADFRLSLIEEKDTLITMRTVVGKNYRQTPVFNSVMNYLVFSPMWTIPPGIMQNDVIPAVIRSTSYLSDRNMRVYDASGKSVDPNTINWRKDGRRYTVRQGSGPQNALGRVKFMFPNKYSVYLHDTPSRELFARDERNFSSGCIRIEKPYELAKILLDDLPAWTDDRIRRSMNMDSEVTVILQTPVGVYLFYLTAWGDIHEGIHYRTDIYSRDEEVYKSLRKGKYDL